MFTLGEPGVDELGVRRRDAGGPGVRGGGESVALAAVADLRLDRPRSDRALEADGPQALTAEFSSSKKRTPAPHNVANALAAALSRTVLRGAAGGGQGRARGVPPDPHRISLVATVAGVDYVDDSKATNPHAAAAPLAAYQPVVWVAGGLFKGADDDLDRLVSSAVSPVARSGASRC